MLLTAKAWRVLKQQGPVALYRSCSQKIRRLGQMAKRWLAIRTLDTLQRRDNLAAQRLAHVKGIVFLLSGVPLDDTGGGSRCTQIALELLRQGYGIVFLNQFPKHESRELDLKISHRDLFIYSLAEFDWERFRRACGCAIAGKPFTALVEFPSKEYLSLIADLQKSGGIVVYDLIDDWNSLLGGTWYSPATEGLIIRMADRLCATAPALVERLERQSLRPVMLLPNAVNARLFDPHRHYARPPDLPPAEWTAIYTGALWGDWFDWDLLKQIAEYYPEASVVVIGDYRGQAGTVPANVSFLGLKPQRELPMYLAHATVALIPWRINAITNATSPLKVYEYLSMHRPVVAPDIHPLRQMPGIWLARNASEFLLQLAQARSIAFPTSAVDAFIAQNNWQVRIRNLMGMVDSNQR